MNVDKSENHFILSRLLARIVIVVLLAVVGLGVSLPTNLTPLTFDQSAIAVSLSPLAAVNTQDEMLDIQNRADRENKLEKQNPPISKQTVTGKSNKSKQGTVSNVQQIRDNTENFSDQGLAQVKNKAKQATNKVENAADNLGNDIKDIAGQAQDKASKDISRVQNATGNLTSNVQKTAEDVVEKFEAESTNQSPDKKGFDKTKESRS
ncbi:MAG: hypothetical protein HC851_18665 [Acaryochloris sp. RU_4_1]|nr:hypothetical protein [Acaryochloris sp. RU_4_1]NJR54225.1 hypothetical protein [Acaryochloris sp. CRU_2_0]